MSNPFEDDEGEYMALVNEEGQYSIWPAHIGVPEGWHIVHEKAGRQVCLEYIEAQWTDMRPRSAAHAVERTATAIR